MHLPKLLDPRYPSLSIQPHSANTEWPITVLRNEEILGSREVDAGALQQTVERCRTREMPFLVLSSELRVRKVGDRLRVLSCVFVR